MDERVLDIWAVQQDPNELFTAMENISTDDVIIFKNLMTKFKIGKKIVETRQFDSMIYSEASDILILLMRGGKAKVETAERYLDEHGLLYHTVQFLDNQTKNKNSNKTKDFWFAREAYVLEDAIKDSISKHQKTCKYNPEIRSYLLLKYPTKENDNEIMLKISFRGLIEFEDKFILPTISKWQKNLHETDILSILEQNGINYTLLHGTDALSL